MFSLHVLFDIIHVSGMKECWFRLQQLSVFQAVPRVRQHLLLFQIISAPPFPLSFPLLQKRQGSDKISLPLHSD